MMRKQRLRPLTEAEAYARCHGMHDSEVRIVKIEPRRPRYDLEVSGRISAVVRGEARAPRTRGRGGQRHRLVGWGECRP
jgi:hypothetical protein